MSGLPKRTSWKIRRRVMFAVIAFFMAVISLVLWKGLDTAPAEAAVTMSIAGIMSIVASYVFGAVWDDRSRSE